MEEICDKTRKIALPWFESTATARGLAQELLILTNLGNSHTFFELGCCYATAGEIEAARAMLEEAIRRFQEAYDNAPVRTWALTSGRLRRSLLPPSQTAPMRAYFAGGGTKPSPTSSWKRSANRFRSAGRQNVTRGK